MNDDMILRPIADLARAGRFDEARANAEAALAGGERPAVRTMAAMLATRMGDAAGAAVHLERLHALDPEDRATRFNLAQALNATGQVERVPALLAPLPREPRLDRMIAFAAARLGDHGQARHLYRDILDAQPGDADSWANLAQVELESGDGDAAIAALERAITLRPDRVEFYLALAQVLERLDLPVARRKVARDAAALRPGACDVQVALGLAEAALGDMSAAESALAQAVEIDPRDPTAVLELGLVLENSNRIDALDALIERVRPVHGAELALLEGWSAVRHGDFAAANRHALRVPDTVSVHRRAHLQALVADRLGEADRAFTLFTAMNAAARETVADSGRSYRDDVKLRIAALRDMSIARAEPPRELIAAPTFVAGFPRSGTTLLDTMLARLPDTVVLEEEPLIPGIEKALGNPARIATLSPAEAETLRDRYRAMLANVAPAIGAHRRVIDKHPLHMASAPLIDRLFPGAPVILVERHPYDVVLSCFMANFRLNHAMRSFTDLTEAALTYDAVFTAWYEAEAKLPLNTHRVRYERLVADPEAELRPLVEFLGANFSPDLLDNVAAARERGPVRTASYAQVTEPLYQRAVARWQRYRAQLAPVIPILRPWAERMGYDN